MSDFAEQFAQKKLPYSIDPQDPQRERYLRGPSLPEIQFSPQNQGLGDSVAIDTSATAQSRTRSYSDPANRKPPSASDEGGASQKSNVEIGSDQFQQSLERKEALRQVLLAVNPVGAALLKNEVVLARKGSHRDETNVVAANEKDPNLEALIGTLQDLMGMDSSSQDYVRGEYNEATEAVVKRFQEAAGLKADGKIGHRTLKAILLAVDPSHETRRELLAADSRIASSTPDQRAAHSTVEEGHGPHSQRAHAFRQRELELLEKIAAGPGTDKKHEELVGPTIEHARSLAYRQSVEELINSYASMDKLGGVRPKNSMTEEELQAGVNALRKYLGLEAGGLDHGEISAQLEKFAAGWQLRAQKQDREELIRGQQAQSQKLDKSIAGLMMPAHMRQS